jgi:hypothetical protein
VASQALVNEWKVRYTRWRSGRKPLKTGESGGKDERGALAIVASTIKEKIFRVTEDVGCTRSDKGRWGDLGGGLALVATGEGNVTAISSQDLHV